jgi:hypothetical protein
MRVDGAKLAPKTANREVPDLAGQLHAGGPGPDDSDRQPTFTLGRVDHHFGHFERTKESSPQLQGVVDSFHAGGIERELVVPEVGLADTGRDYQAVIGDLLRLHAKQTDVHDAAVEVEPGNLRQLNPNVLVLANHMAEWRCNLSGRDHASSHLIQEWLKQMVVAPVDEGDVYRFSCEEAGGGQAAETSAYDHYPVASNSSCSHSKTSTWYRLWANGTTPSRQTLNQLCGEPLASYSAWSPTESSYTGRSPAAPGPRPAPELVFTRPPIRPAG